MVQEITVALAEMFAKILQIVDKIYSSLGGWDLFIGAFIIYLSYRFLLIPLLGGKAGSSDKAKKENEVEE